MIEESRHEKILKAVLNAKFSLKQRIERIHWHFDEFRPAIAKWKSQAQLPEPPSDKLIDVEFLDEKPPKSRSRRARKAARQK